MNRGSAKARLEGLETTYSIFFQNHEKILVLPGVTQEHDYFTHSVFQLTEETYFDRKGEFLQFLEETQFALVAKPVDQNNSQVSEVSQALNLSRFLPKIDIPKFSGKYSEWENFRDIFKSIIGDNSDASSVLKFYYLRTHLTDEALQKIKSLQITNENYVKAWQTLLVYYENKRRFINSHLAELFAVKPMKAELIFN